MLLCCNLVVFLFFFTSDNWVMYSPWFVCLLEFGFVCNAVVDL